MKSFPWYTDYTQLPYNVKKRHNPISVKMMPTFLSVFCGKKQHVHLYMFQNGNQLWEVRT